MKIISRIYLLEKSLWAHVVVLQARKEKIIMIYSKSPSVCSRYICHTYREFVKLSCDVLQGFFEDNPEDTERLLTRNRPRWRNLSCLEIAFRLKHRPFMAHEACKIPINKIWFGRISPENNSFRVWLEKPPLDHRVICVGSFSLYRDRSLFFRWSFLYFSLAYSHAC